MCRNRIVVSSGKQEEVEIFDHDPDRQVKIVRSFVKIVGVKDLARLFRGIMLH